MEKRIIKDINNLLTQLFQKMKEAGYEWDDEKKELKKIEYQKEIQPRYSIGDVLCDKSCTTLDKSKQPNIEVLDIRDGMYICNNCTFPIEQQDEYELVAKRLKDRVSWKPSDEQMDALLVKIPIENSCNKVDNILKSLYSDLKKLK